MSTPILASSEYQLLTPSTVNSDNSRTNVFRNISFAPLAIAECFTVSSMSLIKLTPLGSTIRISLAADRFSEARTRMWVGINGNAARRTKCPDASVTILLDWLWSSLKKNTVTGMSVMGFARKGRRRSIRCALAMDSSSLVICVGSIDVVPGRRGGGRPGDAPSSRSAGAVLFQAASASDSAFLIIDCISLFTISSSPWLVTLSPGPTSAVDIDSALSAA